MKILGHLLLLIPLSMAAGRLTAQTTDQIRTEIKKIQTFLDRIDNGATPCFSSECQTQKYDLLTKIFNVSQTLPGTGTEMLKSLNSAIETATFMVDHPYQLGSDVFPQSLKEWKYWWAKRYSHEQEYRNQWFAFVGEAFAVWESLDIFISASKTDAETQALIQEAWDRGSAEISKLYHEQSWLADRAGVMKALGEQNEAERLMQEAQRAIQRRQELERNFFGGRFRSVMEELFPRLDFKKICAAQARMQYFMSATTSNQLFSRQTIQELSYWRSRLQSLNNLVKTYGDLEYGAVGLKNFHSMTNQAYAVEYEIIIQDFLDKVDLSGRVAANVGATYLMTIAFAASAYPTFVFIGTSTGLNYANAQYNFDMTEYLWASSNRSDQLQSLLPRLKEDMEKRLADLLRSRTILSQRLNHLNDLLNATNKGENS